jgi:hypothetical protein
MDSNPRSPVRPVREGFSRLYRRGGAPPGQYRMDMIHLPKGVAVRGYERPVEDAYFGEGGAPAHTVRVSPSALVMPIETGCPPPVLCRQTGRGATTPTFSSAPAG